MVLRKMSVVGFGGVIAGLPVWGSKKRRIKKTEKHGASALCGRYLAATHNNQPIVSESGRGDVGEEARRG